MEREGNLDCTNDLYEQPWWLDLVAEGRWRTVEVKKDEEIVGRMPYVLEKGFCGNRVVMPIQTQTLGPWVKRENGIPGNKELAHEKEIIEQLLEQLPRHYYLKLMLDSRNRYVLPYYWQGYKLIPRYSYRIKDLSDIEKVYENFGKKTKRHIKHAKNKVEVKFDYDFERLYKVLQLTYQNQNRKYKVSSDVLKRITDQCEQRGNGKMISAIDVDGNLHSCAYFIYDHNVCYYFKGGSDPRYRSSGAATLLLWEGIKMAASVSREFDFEGSMVEGIENFFRDFGGELVTYYEIQKIPLIFEFWENCKPRLKKILGYKI